MMKKQKTTTKILAGVLALVMMATTFVPVQRAAAEDTATEEPEASNITFDTARDLIFNTSIAEEMLGSDTERYYKFALNDASAVNIKVDSDYYGYVGVYIYDKSRTDILYYSDHYSHSKRIFLTGGEYYLRMVGKDLSYTMMVSADSLYESFTETQDVTNNSVNTASDISLGIQYKGVLAQNDDKDYYKFTLSELSKLNINITNGGYGSLKYTIYDSSVNKSYMNTVKSDKKADETTQLVAGTYYLAITKESEGANGSYNFSLSAVKVVDPPKATEKPSTTTQKTTTTQTTTTTNKTVKLKKGKITSAKNIPSKKIDVSWESISGASGYQVQLCMKKNFKKSVTKISTTASSGTWYGLKKKKTYYIRVRAYRVSNGSTKYGKWSAIKKVKIKK